MPVGFRKKKSDVATESKATNSGQKKSKTEAKPAPTKEKQTPVYNEYKSSSPSLKNISYTQNTANEPKKEEKIIQKGPSDPFDEEKLLQAWDNFASSIENSFPRLFQVLKSHKPTLQSENQLELQLNNVSQQKDFIEKLHSKLMGYLKEKLNNFSIELTVTVANEISNQQLVYTASDKYNFLAEQNELLHKLKQNFNLDLE